MKKFIAFIVFVSLAVLGYFYIIKGKADSAQQASKNYLIAVSNNDYEEAHACLSTLYDAYINVLLKVEKNNDLSDYHGRAKVLAAAREYMTAAQNVFCAEARFLISGGSGVDPADRIVYLFNELTPIGYKLDRGYRFEIYDKNKAHFACYCMYVDANNQLCNTIMDLAINSGNKKLAGIALTHYLETNHLSDEPRPYVSGYSNEDKQAAQNRYDEAVKLGLFE